MIYNFEGLEFRVITVDRFVHKKGVFEVKPRPHAAFSFRVSGTGEFEIAGKHLSSTPGTVLFIPANTPYRVEYSGSESIVVHLSHCNYTEAENVTLQNASAVELRFGRLLQSWGQNRSVNRAKSIIYDIFDTILEAKKNPDDDALFADCVGYMEAHYHEPETDVEAVCAYRFISASTLQRAFHEHFGISPKQYLTRLRMNRALELLSLCELSVREVAYACGFTDEKYFSRAFKKHYGCPPSGIKSNAL